MAKNWHSHNTRRTAKNRLQIPSSNTKFIYIYSIQYLSIYIILYIYFFFIGFYLTPAYANPTGWRVERTNHFAHSGRLFSHLGWRKQVSDRILYILIIFSMLYYELVCHIEHFSVELDTLHQRMTWQRHCHRVQQIGVRAYVRTYPKS